MKKILLFILFMFFVNSFNVLFSNELVNDNKSKIEGFKFLSDNSLNFDSSKVIKYKISDSERGLRRIGFTGMGLIIGGGLTVLILGAPLTIAGYLYASILGLNLFSLSSSSSFNSFGTVLNIIRGIFFVGIAFLAIGCLLLIIGIPVCIAGFAAYNAKRYAMSLYIDHDNKLNSERIGISIKI